MLIVSREIGSRPFGVILTVRRAVFICGETDMMVPWRMVPVLPLLKAISQPGYPILQAA